MDLNKRRLDLRKSAEHAPRRRIPFWVAGLLLLAASVGCRERAETVRTADESQRSSNQVYRVAFYLSNQSYRRPWVTVRLQIDGQEMVQQRLFVGRQHSRKQFNVSLPAGHHTLLVTSSGNDVSASNRFTVKTNLWVGVNHWFGDGDKAPYFTIQTQEFPLSFD